MISKSKQKNKLDTKSILVEAVWKKEVEARVKEFNQGNIKTISYSKIKKENRLKFNL